MLDGLEQKQQERNLDLQDKQLANRLGLKGSQVLKGGLGRSTTRIVGKTLGPKAMKAVGPVIKKIGAGFSRVPIVGSLIVAVSSLLAGEPLGQAAFKGLGSAIGGFAGSFIPIPAYWNSDWINYWNLYWRCFIYTDASKGSQGSGREVYERCD